MISRKLREIWEGGCLVLLESVGSFLRNDCLERAATLAYCGFLSLIPLLLLVVFLISHFIRSSDDAIQSVNEVIARVLPLSGNAVFGEVHALAGRRGWGLLTTLILFWSVTPLASSLRSAFRQIFKSDQPLAFFRAKLLDMLAVLVTLVLFVAIVAAKPVYSMAMRVLPGQLSFVTRLTDVLGPFVAMVLFLMLFYRMFTPVKVRWGAMLTGCFVAALLLSVMEPLFGLVLKYNPSYGVTFGSLKAIFLFFVWVYYAFAMVLFGTEIVANMSRRESLLLRRLFAGHALHERRYRALLGRLASTLEEGEVIFREGDAGTEMFYVLRGGVALTVRGNHYRVMKEGEYFGEMAMLLDAPRTMTAKSASPETELIRISAANFDTLVRENPDVVLTILKEMARRLKAADERLEAAVETPSSG